MLEAKHRLRKQKDFDLVYGRGRAIAGPLFNLKFAKNDRVNTRVALVVSKKTAKKAVDRNYAKRLYRAALVSEVKVLKPGFDVVVTIKTVKVKLPEIKNELQRIFKKAGLYD